MLIPRGRRLLVLLVVAAVLAALGGTGPKDWF